MFRLYNHNPKGLKTSDCVIRAFSFATGVSWEDTFTALCNIAIKMKSMPNDIRVYTKYAEIAGFQKCKVDLIDGKKPTVKSFAEFHITGTYILRVANHLTVVKDGGYFDTWDCGHKSVYTYWMLHDTKPYTI